MSIDTELIEGVLDVRLANPPVNGLSLATRAALQAALLHARADPRVRAVLLRGAGKCFSAGGDIRELGTAAASAAPGLSSHVHVAIEDCGKPVIALMHGLALGGGLETALACHYRIAYAQTRIGLPEVHLGLIPLSATQRLPRLIGMVAASELILSGARYVAEDLRSTALFDRILEGHGGDDMAAGLSFAHEILERGAGHPRVRHQPLADQDPEAVLSNIRWRWAFEPQTAARLGALEALSACVHEADFTAGLAKARAIYNSLAESAEMHSARERFLTPKCCGAW
jgi:enoyl-CoA hydratase/carnithine racemase